ncbi:MAG: HAD family hydrolase [Acidiferrobacterales bacterium]
MQSKRACVFVDVDGTLVQGASIERRFVAELWRRRMLKGQQISAGLAFFLRWGWRYGWLTAGKNKAYLTGLNVKDIEKLAEWFVTNNVVEQLRVSVTDRLVQHRKAGEHVALLSGAPDFLVRPLAKHLGVEYLRATVCMHKNGVFTPLPPVVHPFYKGKLDSANSLCRELTSDLSQCIAYADAIYDLPLLRKVAKPIVVYPDRRLRHAAEQAGWEIVAT